MVSIIFIFVTTLNDTLFRTNSIIRQFLIVLNYSTVMYNVLSGRDRENLLIEETK
jgi:hypothetical protein